VLRVSCGPSMISFSLPTKYLLHGTLFCCPLSTGFGLCSLPSRSPHSSPYRPFLCEFTLYVSKPLLVSLTGQYNSPPLLCPAFLRSPIYGFREIIRGCGRQYVSANTSEHVIPFHFSNPTSKPVKSSVIGASAARRVNAHIQCYLRFRSLTGYFKLTLGGTLRYLHI